MPNSVDGDVGGSPPYATAHVASSAANPNLKAVHAPASADDVPASVRVAVAEFVPPPGCEHFPTPTKNNLQRSLIYFFGRRVQSTATGKSQWFCLASPQCRANKTTISTTANISGCTRHLQVFHQLISPKTAQMTRKATSQQQQHEPQQPSVSANVPGDEAVDTSQSVQVHGQLQTDTADLTLATEARTQVSGADGGGEKPTHVSGRENALEWTRVVVVRNLLPVSLASDKRLVQLTRPSTERTLSEKSVRHHLVELYDALSKSSVAKIRKELAVAALPILHLSLIAVSSSSACHSTNHNQHFLIGGCGGCDDTFVALQVTFVSSMFTHEKHVLDVRRFPDLVVSATVNNDTTTSHSSAVRIWLDATLKRFGIEKKHTQSFVTDRSLSTTVLATTASAFLGRPCEFTCLSTCCAALSDAFSSSTESRMRKLVVALHEFIEIACDADFVSCFRGVESHVDDFVGAAVELKSLETALRGLFPWQAVALILERVVQSWDACQVTLSEGISSGVVPQLLREFSIEDVTQSASILCPLGDFFGDLSAPESVCAEAIIRMFAIKQTTLNAGCPLQIALCFDQDHHHRRHQGSEGEVRDQQHQANEDFGEQVVAIEHSELSPFARSLREELSRLWDASIAEKLTTESLSAITCVFFHPCFRQLSFLDAHHAMDNDSKARVHEHVKKMARDVLQWKARLSNSSFTRGNCDDEDHYRGADDMSSKKRRLSRQDKLSRQAEELSRLGFLDAFVASTNSSSEVVVGGDQQRRSSEADWSAADLLVSRELERYLKNESVAFAAVSFDKTLSYWQHKAFDYPTLALVAQAVLSHPAVLTTRQQLHQKSNDSRQTSGGSCIRCCVGGQSRLRWNKQIRDETLVFEELTLVLHHNEQLLNELERLPELSEARAAQVLATLVAERRWQQQVTPVVMRTPADPSIIQV